MKSEGDIGSIGTLDLLIELWKRRFSGAVRLESDAIIKIIYFKDGDLVAASTNDRTDSIGEILLKAGKLTREHLTEAMRKRKEAESTGETLLALGFTSRSELTWARRTQLVGVIRSTMNWSAGSYSVVQESDLPKPQDGGRYSFPQVIIEVFLTLTDRTTIERFSARSGSVLIKTSAFDEAYRGLQLNEDADQVVALVDGQRDSSEIATASTSDREHVLRLLAAFVALGLLEREQADRGSGMAVSPNSDAVSSETPGGGSILAKDFRSDEVGTASEPVPERKPSRVIPFLVAALFLVLVAAAIVVWQLGQDRETLPAGTTGTADNPGAPATSSAPVTIRELNGGVNTDTTLSAGTATITDTATVPAQIPASSPKGILAPPQPTTTVPPPGGSASPHPSSSASASKSGASTYSVRFAIYCRPESVERAKTIGGDVVWFEAVLFKGQQCQRAYYGHYSTATEAAAALTALPESLREGGQPAVVSVERSN